MPQEDNTQIQQQEQPSIGQVLGIDREAEEGLQVDTQKFINKGTKLIHAEQSRDRILNALSVGNPIETVANTTVMIVNRLDEAARQANEETHDLVKIHGALDLIGQVAEVGAASGKIPELSTEEVQASFSVAVEKYIKGEIQAGRIDPKALQSELQKGISQMPRGQKLGLDKELRNINKTALQSTGQTVKENTNGLLAPEGKEPVGDFGMNFQPTNRGVV